MTGAASLNSNESSAHSGRVALVTGAARGIGLAVCRALAAEGGVVAAFDRDEAELGRVVTEQRNQGLQVVGFAGDVSDSRRVDDVVDRVEREVGPLGVVVSVAGILRLSPVVETSDEDWQAVLATNLSGAFFVLRSVARRMAPRRRGSIIAVGSNAGAVARLQMAAYGASKAGLLALVRCLGLELAGSGVRCNLVSPGSTSTSMQRAFWSDANQGERQVLAGDLEHHRLGIPLGRIATAEDIADAVLFLASERARHITLHDLRVDGGATLDA